MKKKFILLCIKELMKNDCFIVPKDKSGRFTVKDRYSFIYKTGKNVSTIIEFFDANTILSTNIGKILEFKPEKYHNIGLLNQENVFHIKIFVFEKNYLDLVQEIEKITDNNLTNLMIIIISLDERKVVFHQGIIYQNHNVYSILIELLKNNFMEITDGETNSDTIICNSKMPVLKVNFFSNDNTVTYFTATVLLFLFLFYLVIAIWTGLKVIEGGVFENIIIFIVVMFNFLSLGEFLESNFNSRKFAIVLFGGSFLVIMAFGLKYVVGPFSVLNGSILYVWLKIRDLFEEDKFILVVFITNLILPYVLCIYTGVLTLLASSGIGVLSGLVLSGCMNFDQEIIDSDQRKNYLFGSIILLVICAVLFIGREI
jgi:hypothetical protein